MAHVAKYSRGSCRAILEHDTRTAKHEYKNPDIDKSRTHLNWSLIVADGMTAEERLNKRLSEIKVQKRKDVNVLCSWVVTLPEDVPFIVYKSNTLVCESTQRFFKAVNEFLTEEVGAKNVISSDVHVDENRPHLHFTFVPVVKNTRTYKDPSKQPKFAEKCCADELLTRAYLNTFHERLESYLNERGIKASIRTGKTTFNRSIAELKAETAEKLKLAEEKIQKHQEESERRIAEAEYQAQIKHQDLLREIDELKAKKAESYQALDAARASAREIVSKAEQKASEIRKKAEDNTTLLDRLTNKRIQRKKAGFLGTVKLSEKEYEDLCTRAEIVDNLLEEKTKLEDTMNGKAVQYQKASNERLVHQVESLQQENSQLRQTLQKQLSSNSSVVKDKDREIEDLQRENSYLKEKVSKLEEWVQKAKDLTEKVWLFAYRLVKSFDEPEVKDEAINLSEELYQNSMISLGEKLTRSRSRRR